jgi:hypothetical protein
VEPGYFALRRALKLGLAQDEISRSEILEAGGVEPFRIINTIQVIHSAFSQIG